jgi:hypothetical protein
MALRSLIVSIEARTAAFETALNQANRKVANFERTVAQAGRVMAAVATAGGLAIAAKKIFDLGAAAEDSRDRFVTTFGQSADAVDRFAQQFGTMAGLSQRATQEMLAGLGATTQAMGFAESQSGQLAQTIARLAGDLAEFRGVETADVVNTLTQALAGQTRGLKQFGIVIDEADVRQRAFEQTGKSVAAALTDQDRATATLVLVTERMGKAAGELARSQDEAGMKAARLRAEFQNLSDDFAVKMLPALERMIPLFQTLVGLGAAWVEQLGFATLQIAEWTKPGTIDRMAEMNSLRGLGAGPLRVRRGELAREQVSLGLGIIEQEEVFAATSSVWRRGGGEKFLQEANNAQLLIQAYWDRVEFVTKLIAMIDARVPGTVPPVIPAGAGAAGLGLRPDLFADRFGSRQLTPSIGAFGRGEGPGSPFAFRGVTAPALLPPPDLQGLDQLGFTIGNIGDAAISAAAETESATGVVIASFGAMAQAAIRGGAQMEVAIISAITQIGQSIVQMKAAQLGSAAGPIGALIGAAGGLLGAIFGGGRRDPAPVMVDSFSDRAQQQQRDAMGEIVIDLRNTGFDPTNPRHRERLAFYEEQDRDRRVVIRPEFA